MAKIYQNKYAGFETYFVPLYPVKTRGIEASKVGGYGITCVNGRWRCEKTEYYRQTLSDANSFPVVGEVEIDINRYVKDAVLDALEMAERRTDGQNQS